jgi:hypothetical protein
MNRKKKTWAIQVAVPATPENPNNPEHIPTIKEAMAQASILFASNWRSSCG